MKRTHAHFPHIFYLLSLTTVFAVFTVLLGYTWPMDDDLTLQYYYRLLNNGSTACDAETFWRGLKMVYEHESGRLANLLALPCLLWMPRWLLTLLMAGMVTGLVAVCMRLASRISNASGNAATVWITLALMLVMLPWRGRLLMTACVFNYILAGLMLTMVILTVSKLRKDSSRRRIAAVCVLCLFTGAMHEGAAICGACAFAGWALVRYKRKSPLCRWQWIAAGAFALGAFALYCSGSIQARQAMVQMYSFPGKREIVLTLLPMATFAVSIFAVVSVKKIKTAGTEMLAATVGATVAGIVLWLIAPDNPRAPFFGQLMAIAGTVAMLRIILRNSTAWMVAGCVGAGLCAVVLFNAVKLQKKLYDRQMEIERQIAAGNGTVYMDMEYFNADAAMNMPVGNGQWTATYIFGRNAFAHRPEVVVPAALSTLRGADVTGEQVYKGLTVTNDRNTPYIDLAGNRIDNAPIGNSNNRLWTRFTTRDGKPLLYIHQ